MKVKELKAILENTNSEAEIIVAYEHIDSVTGVHTYYQEIEDIGYNQFVEKNKLVVDKNKLVIWLE